MLTTIHKAFGRPWHLATAVTLVAVTILGALVQSGSLAPDFHLNDTGISGNLPYANLENISWRSWTITGVQLANAKHSIVMPDKSVLRVGPVYRGAPLSLSVGPSHPAVLPLNVGPGQQVLVTLVQEHQKQCRPIGDLPLNELPQQDHYDIPIDLVFATPLGTRTLAETLVVDYGCPHT